jgi:carotenoid cleavage dioxygenase-like enzyme
MTEHTRRSALRGAAAITAADLLILAAQDFSGEPVARIHLPGRVPLGFHGSWIPDA